MKDPARSRKCFAITAGHRLKVRPPGEGNDLPGPVLHIHAAGLTSSQSIYRDNKGASLVLKDKRGLLVVMVEVRGIEPLSENPSSQLSPSAVCHLDSLARRGQTRYGSGSFIGCVAPLKALRDARSPHFSTPCRAMRYHRASTSCVTQLQQRIRCQLF